ncbi:MAG: hypothetical protein ACT452_14555 [Microthrixaceae bacterium]
MTRSSCSISRLSTRLATFVALILAASAIGVGTAPPAHASFPSSVLATAVASHPNGWVAVQELLLSDDSGDHDFLILRGITPAGEWTWRVDVPDCWCTSARKPQLAFNGTSFLVVWEDDRSGTWDIYGLLVSPTGVVEREPFVVSAAIGSQLNPSVAALGSQFLVAWEDHRDGGANADVYSTRVSKGGKVATPSGVVVSDADNMQGNPSVAASNRTWLVVWTDRRNIASSGVDLYSTRVTPTGEVGNTDGVEVSRAARDQTEPVVAWSGDAFIAAWTDARYASSATDVFGSRISTAGDTLDAAGIPIGRAGGRQSQPTVSRSNGRVLVAWTTTQAYGTSIFARFVTVAGSVGAVVPLTQSCDEPAPVCDPSLPAAAAIGGTVLVVYRVDDTGFQDSMYGQRVSSGGVLVGPPDREYPF